ncbi:MAG: ribosome silencing factor [bacterium]
MATDQTENDSPQKNEPAQKGASSGAAPADRLLELVRHQLDDDKAEDIVTISLDGKSEIADAMVIASGRSQTHVGALADKLARQIKEQGFGSAAIEGMPACDWVLIDAGDVIIHLFRPEVRDFYNLEKIWSAETFTSEQAETPLS